MNARSRLLLNYSARGRETKIYFKCATKKKVTVSKCDSRATDSDPCSDQSGVKRGASKNNPFIPRLSWKTVQEIALLPMLSFMVWCWPIVTVHILCSSY